MKIEELLEHIELETKNLSLLVKERGITDHATINQSQKLDELILLYQKHMCVVKKGGERI